MPILSPETDNCPSSISQRERMTVENNQSPQWMLPSRRGLNPQLLITSRTCTLLSHWGWLGTWCGRKQTESHKSCLLHRKWWKSAVYQVPSNQFQGKTYSHLKAPYSSKIDIFFIQERFNKLIYSINMIIKCGIWQAVKFQLVSHFWTGSKIKIFLLYLWINVGNINSEIR